MNVIRQRIVRTDPIAAVDALPAREEMLTALHERDASCDGLFHASVSHHDRRLLPLAYPGNPFQRRVWDALRRIPCGETRTSAELEIEGVAP